MAMIGYVARVLTGVRFKKMNHMIDVVHQKCGQNKVRTFFDMLWCAVRYGAGYYDYTMFGFYDMTGAQRDTYLTRVRNKKVSNIMNDMAHDDDFDDKLLFNVRFAKYLRRPTLNGETATPEQMAQFLEGQEAIFAKINHGSCGNGVEKLYVKDFESPAAMLDYIREKKLVVLEHVQAQHPDMARLHPQSVNTMRICTDLVDGRVHIAYITLKMGRGGGVCDNSGQGGILCRVDIDTGKICSPATDDYFNVFDKHPDTGIPLVGYQLPMIEEAKALACQAALEIPEVGHVGWDMAIGPDGPAIIEGNDFPGTDLCQLAPFCPEKTGLWPYYKERIKRKSGAATQRRSACQKGSAVCRAEPVLHVRVVWYIWKHKSLSKSRKRLFYPTNKRSWYKFLLQSAGACGTLSIESEAPPGGAGIIGTIGGTP